MTPQQEYIKYHLENDLPCLLEGSNFTAVFDPVYNKRFGNDFSKPRVVLCYSHKTNRTVLIRINTETLEFIRDNTTVKIELSNIKDKQTFLDFVYNELNPYCIEHNCDYNTYINNKIAVNSHKEDNISIKCSRNRNQEIVYNKIDNFIRFLEVDDESKPVIDSRFKLNNIYNDFIKDNFAEFAKESFEFCEENKCSFRNYAEETALNIIQLKFFINRFYNYRNPQKKPLYTFFDKDVKTAFTYYNDNTIDAFKIIDNKFTPVKEVARSSNSINSNEEFKKFIKDNRTIIDRIVNKKLEEHKKRKLERIRNANGNFDKSASEVKMNGKPNHDKEPKADDTGTVGKMLNKLENDKQLDKLANNKGNSGRE